MVSSDRRLTNPGAVNKSTFCENVVWLEQIVDNPFEGLLAIDETGTVVFANSFFLGMLTLAENMVIGRKVGEVIPGYPLLETVRAGHSRWGETLRVGGREFVVARLPLREEGKVVGALLKTLFPDMVLARSTAEKVVCAGKATGKAYRALHTCRDLVGESPVMLDVKSFARKAARTNSTLLITGESGTGKGVVAQAIHNRSARREGPFISINCAAIPDNLLEAELFGYADGAFTGAKKGGKPGKFEMAEGGTIFLDEIGDMPLAMQGKLLSVLQEKEVERIGATKQTRLNVRVVTATNQNLKELVAKKLFREDLYYRLKVLEIRIPPLRERLDDIPMLVEALLQRINTRLGAAAKGLTAGSLQMIVDYDWPGNVRELENILEQAVIWSDEAVIDLGSIPVLPWVVKRQAAVHKVDSGHVSFVDAAGTADAATGRGAVSFHQAVQDAEKELILKALARAAGNKAQAARLLDIQRSVLYKKLAQFNL